LPTSGLL
jgi:hypothetical protein